MKNARNDVLSNKIEGTMSMEKTFNTKIIVLCAVVGAAVGVIGPFPIGIVLETLGYRLLDAQKINYSLIPGTDYEWSFLIVLRSWCFSALAAGVLGSGLGFILASRSPRWWKAALGAVAVALLPVVVGSVITTVYLITGTIANYNINQEIQATEMRPAINSIPTLTATFQELTQVDNLRAFAVSPDGHFMAYGVNADIYLWDLLKNTALQPPLHSHSGNINKALAFSPDSRLLVSAGTDKKVLVWNVSSGERLFELDGHQASIFCLAVSSDGTLAASGDTLGNIILWDITSGKEITRPATGSDSQAGIRDLIFSPDGKLLAFATLVYPEYEVHLWDIASAKPAGDLQIPISLNNINQLAFSPDSSLLAANTMNGIFLWDIKTLSPLGTTQEEILYGEIGFSPDGRSILSVSNYMGRPVIVLFDSVTRQAVGRWTNPGFACGIADPYFLPDGRVVMNCFGDNDHNRIVVWTLSGQ